MQVIINFLKTVLLVVLVIAAIAVLAYFAFPSQVFYGLRAVERSLAGLEEHSVQVGDHDIPYLEGGHGEPLLLLHGFGGDKDNWLRVAPYLTPHYRVILPDLPGFGDSTRLEDGEYTITAQVRRLEAFMDVLGLMEAHVGGNSMGGNIAGVYGGLYPDRVKTLWLLAPAGVNSAEPSEFFLMVENGENPLIPRDAEGYDYFWNMVFEQPPFMPEPFRDHYAQVAMQNADFNDKVFQELWENQESASLERVLDGSKLPTLIVWGDKDRLLHPSGAERLAEHLKDVQVVVMPQIGHVPMLEAPKKSADLFIEFERERGPEQPAVTATDSAIPVGG